MLSHICQSEKRISKSELFDLNSSIASIKSFWTQLVLNILFEWRIQTKLEQQFRAQSSKLTKFGVQLGSIWLFMPGQSLHLMTCTFGVLKNVVRNVGKKCVLWMFANHIGSECHDGKKAIHHFGILAPHSPYQANILAWWNCIIYLVYLFGKYILKCLKQSD